MLDFPKTLHPLHLFEAAGIPYAADLEKARIVELSAVMADILKIAETHTSPRIVETLSAAYGEDTISEAFERLAELEKEGLLFNRGEDLQRRFLAEGRWRKLLIVIPSIEADSFFDIETLSAGTNMALSYMIQHLTKYADLHFAGSQNRKITDGIYEVDIGVEDLVRLRSKIGETYLRHSDLASGTGGVVIPALPIPGVPTDSRSEPCTPRARRAGDELHFSALCRHARV